MHWRILPLMMIVVALAHFNRISITVAGAEQIIPNGLISKERMGWVYSAFLIVYTLCMAPGGWFLDRFGPRAAWMVLVFGSTFFVIVTGLIGLYVVDASLLFIALLAVRSCFGVVCVPLHPTAARLVGNWTPVAKADFANGLINAAALVGIAFTYILFGMLIDHFGWPQAFLIAGGVTFTVAVLWYWFGADYPALPNNGQMSPDVADEVETGIKEPPSPYVSDQAPPAVPIARAAPPLHRNTASLMFLTLGYGLIGYFQYLFFYWAEFYFENEMKLSTSESRWSTTLLTLAMAAGMFGGGWLSDFARRRWPGRWGLIAVPGLALAIAGTATFLTLGDIAAAAVVAGLTVAMGAAGISEGSYWTTAVRLGRRHGGKAAAIMNTAGNGIGLTAPLLTPYISDAFGWKASLGIAAVVCWAGALCWLGVNVNEPREALDISK
jgi:MFS family permease